MPIRAEYVALKDLYSNGVLGYSKGDPVPAGPVENLGYVIGEDVAPSGLALMPKPAKNASRATWAAYAADQGMDQDEIDGMTRDQLATSYDEAADTDSDG
jgi:hypothetical protein